MESWKREARPNAWDESVSMNARDQARVQKKIPGGRGSELPTFNFHKQKKKKKQRDRVGGGFQFWD